MTDKKAPTIGRLLDSILRLRSKRHVACDEAIKRVHERFAEKEIELLATVDEATRAKVVAMLQADDDPPQPAAVPDLEPPATTPPPAEPEEIPETRERVDLYVEEMPKGTTPYQPGPAAQAARARK